MKNIDDLPEKELEKIFDMFSKEKIFIKEIIALL